MTRKPSAPLTPAQHLTEAKNLLSEGGDSLTSIAHALCALAEVAVGSTDTNEAHFVAQKPTDAAETTNAASRPAPEALIWVDPRRMGGIPCVFGTRVPVDQLQALLGEATDEQIAWIYPAVTVEQVARLREFLEIK